MAITYGWKGAVDTDLRFSEFYANDHTVTVWFLPQYPNAYAGPILSVNGTGNYLVAQGDRNTQASAHLISRIDDASEIHVPAVFPAGQWYHLAVIRRSNQVHLFLNGQMYGSPLKITDTNIPSGTLRLGRLGPFMREINNVEAQFYGMMDELAIYTRALTNEEIMFQFTNREHLTGNESDLLAGWLFSPTPPPGLPSKMLRSIVLSGQTALVVNSSNWDGSDMQLIPLPEHQTMELPFLSGEAWGITQGFAADYSHRGFAAFCLDFQKADSLNQWTDVYPNGSFNAPVYSTDNGTVTYVSDNSPLSATEGGGENMIWIRCADGFTRQYLHLLKDSALVAVGQQISAGQQIAKISTEWLNVATRPGPHLHFGIVSDQYAPDVATIPLAFSNYEVRNPDGSWSFVPKGIPRSGQIVRRIGLPGKQKLRVIWYERIIFKISGLLRKYILDRKYF